MPESWTWKDVCGNVAYRLRAALFPPDLMDEGSPYQPMERFQAFLLNVAVAAGNPPCSWAELLLRLDVGFLRQWYYEHGSELVQGLAAATLDDYGEQCLVGLRERVRQVVARPWPTDEGECPVG